MADFQSKWMEWVPPEGDDEAFVSFGSPIVARSQEKQDLEPTGGRGSGPSPLTSLQVRASKEGIRQRTHSERERFSGKRRSMALTKLTKAPTGALTGLAELERDYVAALDRARTGFTFHGITPTPETLEAAAVLELWIYEGAAPRPGMSLADLKDWTREIYRGRGSARLTHSGRVVLRAVPAPG